MIAACAMGMHAETFVKVTDVSTLNDGDKVVLGNAENGKVSAGFMGNKETLTTSAATFTDGKATLDDPTYITLKKSGDNWKMFIGTKPIGHEAGNNKFDTKQKTETEYSISIAAGGAVSIISQTTTTYAFYYNTSSPRFGLYTSSSTNTAAIELYKLDEGSIPEKVPTAVELNKESAEVRVGATLTLTADVTPSDAADKSVNWGSTNTGVATVSDGVVTPVAAGETKIWVKTTAGENVTDTCVVTVLPALDLTEATYKAVQKADYLPAGAKVFFGTIKDGENYVMGLYAGGNNIKGVAATYGTDRHSVTAQKAYAYTVERDGNYYLFKDQDGKYLRTISSTKLGNGAKDDYAKWTLGAFDENDATVVLTNGKNTSCSIYNNFQGTNDLFNVYSSFSADYCAKTVLYSDQAPDWVERVKNPSMVISGDDLKKENDQWVIDWGKQEPDEVLLDWGDTRYYTMTLTDLPDDIKVTLSENTSNAFSLQIGGETISSNPTSTPKTVQRAIYWEASAVGVYTAKLTFHTETAGVEDIVVSLRAEAVEKQIDPATLPQFSATVDHVYLNPNYENGNSDIAEFKFSASNLAKKLYCKWQHTSSVLFDYDYQNSYMQIEVGNEGLALNGSVEFEPNQDYTDVEVMLYVEQLYDEATYTTSLWFYSYEAGSKDNLAIDVTIPITIKVSEQPKDDPTGLERPSSDSSLKGRGEKVLREGRLYILRGEHIYTATGDIIR